MLNDPLSIAMSNIMNAERVGKKSCVITPSSKLIIKVLDIMSKHGYIGKYDVTDNNKGGMITVELVNKINKCGVIKPRLSVTMDDYPKFEKRYLPAAEFGLLIVTTTKGIMVHKEAINKKLGGRLLAFVY